MLCYKRGEEIDDQTAVFQLSRVDWTLSLLITRIKMVLQEYCKDCHSVTDLLRRSLRRAAVQQTPVQQWDNPHLSDCSHYDHHH